MNRTKFKSIIKKVIIQEILNNQFGTPNHREDEEGAKALEKAVGKEGKVTNPPGTGKVVSNSPKHSVELVKNADDLYDVVSVTNGAERKTAKSLKLEDAVEFIKKHAEGSEKSSVEKAYDKSEKGFGKQTEDEEADDSMDDADEETQVKIADKEDVKAEKKVDKDLAPINKDNSLQLGGDLVDKIERIIDMALQKKVNLKPDKEMKSPDKLTTKLKDTPTLKEKKK